MILNEIDKQIIKLRKNQKISSFFRSEFSFIIPIFSLILIWFLWMSSIISRNNNLFYGVILWWIIIILYIVLDSFFYSSQKNYIPELLVYRKLFILKKYKDLIKEDSIWKNIILLADLFTQGYNLDKNLETLEKELNEINYNELSSKYNSLKEYINSKQKWLHEFKNDTFLHISINLLNNFYDSDSYKKYKVLFDIEFKTLWEKLKEIEINKLRDKIEKLN